MALTYEDKEFFNKLFQLSKTILEKYLRLHDLEINGLKDTPLYQKEVETLSSLINLENEFYQRIEKIAKYDLQRISLFLDYVDRGSCFKDFSDYTILLNGFDDFIIYKRVYNHIQEIYESTLIKIYQKNVSEDDEQSFDNVCFVNSLIHHDIEKAFSFLIEEKANNENYINYQDALHIYKYFLSFLNPGIEKEFFKNSKFNKDECYLFSHSMADTLGIDDKTYHLLRKKYFNKYLKSFFLNFKDKFQKLDYYQQIRYILEFCLLKSYLLFLDEEKDSIKEEIYAIIKNDKNNYQFLSQLIERTTPEEKVKVIRSERLYFNENSK